MPIDKSKLDKLKGLSGAKPLDKHEKKAAPEKPLATAGFTVGLASRLKKACFVMDAEGLGIIDEMTFRLKKRIGKRVSASELVRAAVYHFSKLEESEQIRLLNG